MLIKVVAYLRCTFALYEESEMIACFGSHILLMGVYRRRHLHEGVGFSVIVHPLKGIRHESDEEIQEKDTGQSCERSHKNLRHQLINDHNRVEVVIPDHCHQPHRINEVIDALPPFRRLLL